MLFSPPESGATARGRLALPPGQSQKEGIRGHFYDPLHGPGCSQTSYPASGLLFELLWVLFNPEERGGAAFGSPTLPPQLNSGRDRKGPLPWPPTGLGHSRYWLIVMLLFFGHLHDPGVRGGSLRPPGAAVPKNLRRPFWSSLPQTALPDG